MDKKSYIKEHSWSGFKSGVKYSSYLYLGATIASLLISLAIVPIFPFTLLISNPVVWAMLGVAFVGLSAAAVSVAKPLFHWANDSIDQKKVEKQEGKDREKVVDENEKQPELVLNIETESPSSLLSNVDVNRQELLLRSNNFISATIKGDYKKWLLNEEIDDIAEKRYGYPDEDNGVIFGTWPLYGQHEKVPYSSKKIRERIESLNITYFDEYREKIKETERLNRPILSLILGLHDHWVTLVIDYDSTNKRFRAYYCNPFGGIYNRIDTELLKCLEEEQFFPLRREDIRISKTEQQKKGKDGWNCGIYALENAKIITDMMKEGRSLDEIDGKLAGYVHADEKQEERRMQEKRKEFAEVLMNNMSRMDDREFKQKIKNYERPVYEEEPPKAMCR